MPFVFSFLVVVVLLLVLVAGLLVLAVVGAIVEVLLSAVLTALVVLAILILLVIGIILHDSHLTAVSMPLPTPQEMAYQAAGIWRCQLSALCPLGLFRLLTTLLILGTFH